MSAPSPQRKQRKPGPSTASNAKAVPGLTARARAVDLVHGVLHEGQALEGAFDRSPDDDAHSADRALTHALVMTTLRRLPTVDAAINACLDKPLHKSAARAMTILRVMAAQLLVMDIAGHAAVTLAVEDASRRKDVRKLKNLINAIGRRMVREHETFLATAPPSDLPAWLATRWTRNYGKVAVNSIAQTMREQPAIDLTLKPGSDRAALLDALAEYDPLPLGDHAIRLTKPGSIGRLPGFAEGTWWVQDYAASLPARILLDALPNPQDARVLDLCAAPGGKTAQLVSAGCMVTALDQSSARMKRLSANIERLNLSVDIHIGDALAYNPGKPFDAVLLDAPCSATGTLRRNPDIGYLRRESDILSLAKLQSKLLDQAASMVKPSGVLVFATCSLEPEEGKAQITRFLNDHPGWQLEPVPPQLAPPGAIIPDGTLRTLPHLTISDTAKSGMDGFFAARLRAP